MISDFTKADLFTTAVNGGDNPVVAQDALQRAPAHL